VEILLYILGVLIIAVGIVLSIGLHEIGHLVPAKRFGVHVGQYMIGFGRTLWSRKFGETEYGVKAIPLGGYISMAGMFPPLRPGGRARNSSTGFMETMMQDARDASSDTVKPGDENRVFYKLAIWKRIIIMLGGPTMNLIIGIGLYAIVLCGFGVAQSSTTIGNVSACVLADSSQSKTCTAEDPRAPAAAAGIKPGDRLEKINGTTITSWDQAVAIIRKSAGEKVAIVVERDGASVALSATPILNEVYVQAADGSIQKDASGTAETTKVGFLGIGAATETVQQPITAVLPAVGNNVARVAQIIVTLPQRLVAVANAAFGPGERDPNGPISVVGVGRIAGEIASIDTAPVASRAAALISLLASLNIALFVFNLIPLMPLDGGHVAGALWEGIRRQFARLFKRPDPGPVDIAKLLPLTMAVTIVLSAMSVLLIYADIVKPITLQ
jgi:membrane-associated protease RseP (regulator of RpoE activity)